MDRILQELGQRLTRVLNRESNSGDLANWASDRHWDLLEGKESGDASSDRKFMRELFYEILMEREILIANHRSTTIEFSDEQLQEWLSKVQSQKQNVSAVLERIRKSPRFNPIEYGLPDSTDMIREDRDRGYSFNEEE